MLRIKSSQNLAFTAIQHVKFETSTKTTSSNAKALRELNILINKKGANELGSFNTCLCFQKGSKTDNPSEFIILSGKELDKHHKILNKKNEYEAELVEKHREAVCDGLEPEKQEYSMEEMAQIKAAKEAFDYREGLDAEEIKLDPSLPIENQIMITINTETKDVKLNKKI